MGKWWKPLITSKRIRRAQTNVDKMNQEYFDDLVLQTQEMFQDLCEEFKKFQNDYCHEDIMVDD